VIIMQLTFLCRYFNILKYQKGVKTP